MQRELSTPVRSGPLTPSAALLTCLAAGTDTVTISLSFVSAVGLIQNFRPLPP